MLIEIGQVKKFLGISGSSDDAALNDLIANFSAFVETMANRKFNSDTFTEYFNGGEQDIFLANLPVVSITTVKYNAGTQAAPSWQTVPAGDYTTYYDIAMIRHASAFPSGSRNIEVIYVGGFTNVPSDIALLAKLLVARAYEQRRAQGKGNENIGEAGVNWTNEMTPEQKAILSSWRKPNF